MFKNIPVYYASVDEEGTGMLVVSFVDNPATETEWQLFNAVPQSFKIEDESERKVLGVVMLAETPIYRKDDERGEYYIKFSKDTIEKMVQKFFKEGYQENIDANHSFQLIDGAEIQQAFIKDTEKGISPVGFESVPDGSLFFTYKITDDNLWGEVKNGSWTGFSLAGSFALNEYEDEDADYQEVMAMIEKLKNLFQK